MVGLPLPYNYGSPPPIFTLCRVVVPEVCTNTALADQRRAGNEQSGYDHVLDLKDVSIGCVILHHPVPFAELLECNGQILFVPDNPDLFPHMIFQGSADRTDSLR